MDVNSKSFSDSEASRRILMNELKRPENRECADCCSKRPAWASASIGIFLCINCASLHRPLGVHISRIKSCALDSWKPDEVAFMVKMGNANAKRIWEHLLPPDYGKPSENEDSQLVGQWILTKYQKRKFMHPNPESVMMQIDQEATDRAEASSAKSAPKTAPASGSGTSDENLTSA